MLGRQLAWIIDALWTASNVARGAPADRRSLVVAGSSFTFRFSHHLICTALHNNDWNGLILIGIHFFMQRPEEITSTEPVLFEYIKYVIHGHNCESKKLSQRWDIFPKRVFTCLPNLPNFSIEQQMPWCVLDTSLASIEIEIFALYRNNCNTFTFFTATGRLDSSSTVPDNFLHQVKHFYRTIKALIIKFLRYTSPSGINPPPPRRR